MVHKVRVSTEADKLIRHAAEQEGVALSEWWRRAIGEGLLRSARAGATDD